jgi:hypothetical protein
MRELLGHEKVALPVTRERLGRDKSELPATRECLRQETAALPSMRQRGSRENGSLRRRKKARMTKRLHPVRVALHLPDKVPDLLILSSAVGKAMAGNRWFASPVPSLAKVSTATKKLEKSQAASLDRTRGIAEARDADLSALRGLLKLLGAYVQGVADDNPEHAASIIESAGLSVALRGSQVKVVLAVSPGRVSEMARLVAKAVAKEASYEWAMSKNAGKTWLSLPKTLQAHTTVSGLVPGKTYWFRMRAATRRGVGDWCEPVEYLAR